jgi:hypothetical protein
VVHVNIDPAGTLTLAQLDRVLAEVRSEGFEVLATDLDKVPPRRRVIELLQAGDDAAALRRTAKGVCARALAKAGSPTAPRVVAVSFMSSGTVEDAVGVVAGFGLEQELDAIRLVDEDVALVRLAAGALAGASPGKLQTALEAALNREVRLLEAPSSGAATAPVGSGSTAAPRASGAEIR